ncbi:DNA binding protein with helix-turn-helix domain [Corynebacterium mustelae]|uniref:DNA binding protein with helix-turn-helix domain n=1 Tax=Corynebacterium mustelae TaxID=571915 RepID=A0A0G3GVV5_9CORY|nr:winged helix-turn-helix domain-containing protein [Corynebacterium mustelae]AKK04635.1 DNA binding protein with helix-turn-helix domain [Corynebacterium mustelae]
MDDFLTRLEAVEHRVSALEQQLPTPAVLSDDGMVTFSGSATAAGGNWEYEWARPAAHLIDTAWESSLNRVAALAHPQRFAIMRTLIDAPTTVPELVARGITTSQGSCYHHVNALVAAGWVEKTTTGQFRIPGTRVIPLLCIIAAGELP